MAGARRQASAKAVRRLLVAATTLVWAVCLASAAWAHASLVWVEPRDGSLLAKAPKSVELHFNEVVTAGAVNLVDATGHVRSDVAVEADGATIKVVVPAGLPKGTSVVSYRVISQDGHPVAGSVIFSVGAPSAAKLPESTNTAVAVLIWLARIAVYVGLFAGIGGVFFVVWIAAEPAATRIMSAALATGLLGAALSIGLQGLDVLGLPLSALVSAAPWRIALSTSIGTSLIIALGAMIMGLLALRIASTRSARALSALALAGAGIALAASGHAATAPPQALTRPAMFLHATAVAFWLGSFAPLAALLLRESGTSLPIIRRFSSVAIVVVAVLAVTGTALAAVQLESFAALVDTSYGLILATKLVLVGFLLALAALNRFRLSPALNEGAKSERALVRSIVAECVLASVILLLVAGWRFTPPPRSLVPEAPLAIHIHTDKAMFQVLITPGRVGPDDFVLQLMDGDGGPLKVKEATMTLSQPSVGIEGIERPGVLGPDAFWHVSNVPLSAPGRWHIRIDALVTDFEKITLEDDFDITGQ
jgi:copper transport protein